MRLLPRLLFAALLLLGVSAPALAAGGTTVYLPLTAKGYTAGSDARRVNAPYLNVSDILGQKFSEMAIFWFGRVSQTENYADVRVAFNDTELVIYVASFDRRIWYDTTPATADLVQWDAVTVFLNTTGNGGIAPTTSAFRLDAQLNNGGTVAAAGKAAYRGNGTGWAAASVTFTATAGWRGGNINDNGDDRGGVMSFRIPFASLGITKPALGSAPWGLAVVLHDRDEQAGPALADKFWPETFSANSPATWGQLRWGIPAYTPPSSTLGGTVTVRHQLNGATVLDAGVGGTIPNLCGGGGDFWTHWGNANYGSQEGFAVQNQDDIADWPCFAKVYLNFPLSAVPAGKVIRSATLTLHQTGGSGPASNGDQPADEFIQVLTTAQDWTDSTITWNNAPLALENFAGAWVGTVVGCGGSIAWPCVPRQWNVTAAVAQAYSGSGPARLVLYSANTAYSTGKYFTSSNSGDWNAAGRPTLTVEWGNP